MAIFIQLLFLILRNNIDAKTTCIELLCLFISVCFVVIKITGIWRDTSEDKTLKGYFAAATFCFVSRRTNRIMWNWVPFSIGCVWAVLDVCVRFCCMTLRWWMRERLNPFVRHSVSVHFFCSKCDQKQRSLCLYNTSTKQTKSRVTSYLLVHIYLFTIQLNH